MPGLTIPGITAPGTGTTGTTLGGTALQPIPGMTIPGLTPTGTGTTGTGTTGTTPGFTIPGLTAPGGGTTIGGTTTNPITAATTTPTTQELYGTGTVDPAVTWDPSLLKGLGPASLSAPSSWGSPQTFTPTTPANYQEMNDLYNFQQWMSSSADPALQDWLAGTNAGDKGVMGAMMKDPYFGSVMDYLGGNLNDISIGQVKNIFDPVLSGVNSTQNANLSGYNATNASNAQYAQYLQTAAIAQNRLLGQLNQRGLLGSYLKGGAGNTDMNLLQQELNNSANDSGAGLQQELSGLNSTDAQYQLALNNYENEFSNYGQQQASNKGGILDWLGLGASALPLVAGL